MNKNYSEVERAVFVADSLLQDERKPREERLYNLAQFLSCFDWALLMSITDELFGTTREEQDENVH